MGVVVVVLLLVIVVLGGLGAWVGVVCVRKWKEGKQGSFDISVSELDDGSKLVSVISSAYRRR